MEQLPLFKRLPIPRGAVPWRRRRYPAPPPPTYRQAFEQLAFTFRLRVLERDIDTEFDFPVHAVMLASSTGAYDTDAPRSVFDLVARPLRVMGTIGFAGTGQFDTRIVRKVEVGEGVTRTVGAAYPVRMTPEDEERERRRRAKQRPPKPTKKAKTRSRALLDLIGRGDDDY